jgi:aryl-alcohol dehydrogenase-like predicted oxidoreductase
MHRPNRREFLRHTLAVGSAAALPVSAWPAQVRRADDVIELGPGKVKVSRLALGTGTFGGGSSSNQMRKLGADGIADVWWNAFDNGVFFWDTADAYGSHAAIKVALKKVSREKVTILTKTDARTADQVKANLDRYFMEMGTDYIDIVLLHSRMSPKWDELDKGLMEVLSAAKQAKKVRAVGISCHSLEAMKVAAKSPWLDVCLCRINPAGVRMDAPTDQVLPLLADLKANGKGVLGMKILGEGQLRDRVDEALRFAVTKDAVHAFTIGVESRAELKDLLERIPKVSQPA